jgi:predicted ester cyclase
MAALAVCAAGLIEFPPRAGTLTARDGNRIEDFIAPNYRGFDADAIFSGIDGYKQHFVTITTGFPDLFLTIETILAEQDRVAARWRAKGTHTGNFGGIPPKGKQVHITGIAIVRIENALIVEEHANSDALGLLKQLGVIPESINIVPLLF